ncbi:MAG: M1 family peptidase [Rhodospirillales bacterium]|nr:M1 family peptidase [Rhodospirillales bacterium]
MNDWSARIVSAMAFACLSLVLSTASAAEPAPAHHNARVSLDPASGKVEVRNTITLEAQDRVTLRLEPTFVVESLDVDGERRAPDRLGDFIAVDVGGQGKHTINLHTRASLATQTDHEQPPFLRADGGFLAQGWLGQPIDRAATYAIEVTTALPHIAVLPGRLQKETRTNESYTAIFTSDGADSPPVLITGPFEVTEKIASLGQPHVRIRTYFHPELSTLANGYLDDTARYIEHYAKTIGPFPYAGFAIVSGPAPIGIGLPGMTYMGRTVLTLPFIRATSLPHEVLHNWWGNAVGIDYATGNWAEGLTSYQADHAQAASRSQDGGREKRLEWLRNYAALPTERDQPVTTFQSKTHDATQVVGYDKVAFIFHMLKTHLGGDVFDKATQRFYADNRHHTASWANIKTAFERESGQDLSAFFDAWLNRPGAPELALRDVKAEGQHLAFSLIQTQDGAAYPLTLNATVTTQAGEQQTRLTMDQKNQSYTVTTDAPPNALSIDPNFDVFRRLSKNETPPILRDVTLNDATRLIAPGKDASTRTIARVLAEDLMQASVPEIQALSALPQKGSLIVAGLKADVLAFLKQNALPLPPKPLDLNVQALAYVVRETNGRTTLVAMAADDHTLEALARALPHYKRRSFAVMNEGVVTDKGTWNPEEGPLSVRLD